MHTLPLKKVLVYLVAGVVVLSVGLWAIISGLGGDSADGQAVVIDTTAPLVDLTATGTGGPDNSTTSTTVGRVYVQVAGVVVSPGVYEVPADARVFQVVEQAGGFSDEAFRDAVALAAHVSDGCVIYVPREGEELPVQVGGVSSPAAIAGSGTGPVGSSSGGSLISLNQASATELEALPGIGPKLAQKIVSYRETNGPFTSVDQLIEVPGIGPSRLEDLRPLICL